jgi:ArsR family transcriptional regulator
MPNPESIRQTAGLFKALGDETRMRILCALKETELCVCDLCAVLEMNQSAISHQLRFLKQSRLVRSRRDGRIIYYSLDDDHVGRILEVGISHAGVH